MTEPETLSCCEPPDDYLTDPRMHLGWRLISNMKDAIAHFGFLGVFRGGSKSGART